MVRRYSSCMSLPGALAQPFGYGLREEHGGGEGSEPQDTVENVRDEDINGKMAYVRERVDRERKLSQIMQQRERRV